MFTLRKSSGHVTSFVYKHPGYGSHSEADEPLPGQGVQADPLPGGGVGDVRLWRLSLCPFRQPLLQVHSIAQH